MYITEIINKSLLLLIKEYGSIKYLDLKKIYVDDKRVPGVMDSSEACFDDELNVLKAHGYINIKDNIITFIHN